jgi:hypothetical protein
LAKAFAVVPTIHITGVGASARTLALHWSLHSSARSTGLGKWPELNALAASLDRSNVSL